ncbi:uncharacterized protein LOC144161524 [Haemaphysalis longicornis]
MALTINIDYELRRGRESELLRYRSRSGLLDINRIERSLFEQQFRFQKDDIDVLVEALLIPEVVVSAQKVTVPGRDALCLALRRLAYPNRWCDLQNIFGLHYSVMSSVTSKVLKHIVGTFGHLLKDCNNHTWLSPSALAYAVQRKGAPLTNCWAFIDGTGRLICRPKRNQKAYFSGHKRVHCLKYQSLMCPNGIICQLDGPYPGRRHDAGNLGILKDSGLYFKLEQLVKDDYYVIYGDPAYPLQPLIMKPYGGFSLTAVQEAFNKGMSSVRQAVEWGFGKVVNEFAFLDFKKNQKLLRQQVVLNTQPAFLCTLYSTLFCHVLSHLLHLFSHFMCDTKFAFSRILLQLEPFFF